MKKAIVEVCLFGLALFGLVAVVVVLHDAYAGVIPLEVRVDDASLKRLDLAGPVGNGTAPSINYNLTLAVAVRNPNWAMSAWRTGPLGAELRSYL